MESTAVVQGIGIGGMVMRMSLGHDSHRRGGVATLVPSMYCCRTWRSSALSAPAGDAFHAERSAGRCSCIVARARCSALLAAATLVSRRPAVSVAGQPSTSRAISAARCRGGSDLERGEERELDRLARDDDRIGLVVRGARSRPGARSG